MSRGLGQVERRVLRTLADLANTKDSVFEGMLGKQTYWYLDSLTEGEEDKYGVVRSTRSEVESARRAVRSLRRKGLVETTLLADGVECIRLAVRITEAGRAQVEAGDRP